MTAMPATMPVGTVGDAKSRFVSIIVFALFAILLIGVVFPRFLGFGPAILGLAGFLAFRPVYGFWPQVSKFFLIWTILIVSLMVLSAFWAMDSELALKRALKIGLLFSGGCLLFSLMRALPAKASVQFNAYFPYVFAVAAAFCYLQIQSNGFLHDMLRPYAEIYHPENFSRLNRAIVILVLCFVIAFNASRSEPFKKAGIIVGLMLPIFFLTASQSAQLGLLAGLFFYFVFFLYRKKTTWLILGIFLSALIGGAPWIAQLLFAHIPPLFDHIIWLKNGPSAFARMEIWNFVSTRALENPLWGHGVEATRLITDFETQKLYHRGTDVLHPHNAAIQVWIEFGAIGAALLSAFCAMVLKAIHDQGLPAARVHLSLFMACIAIAFCGYGLWQGWWIGLLVLVSAYAALSTHEPQNA